MIEAHDQLGHPNIDAIRETAYTVLGGRQQRSQPDAKPPRDDNE